MTWAQLVGLCVGTAAILAAGYGLARLLRDLWKGFRKLSRMLDDWLGEPGRPGLIDRLTGVEKRLGAVEDRLTTHMDGVATVDQIAALERRLAAVESRLPSPDGQPRLESGGIGFQAERAELVGADDAAVRIR